MAEPAYRKATNDDADAIATVGVALWEELGAQSGLPGPMTAEGVRSRMAEWGERGGIFVCDEEGICGFAIAIAQRNA